MWRLGVATTASASVALTPVDAATTIVIVAFGTIDNIYPYTQDRVVKQLFRINNYVLHRLEREMEYSSNHTRPCVPYWSPMPTRWRE